MIGNSWWSDVVRRGEEPKQCPPRVIVSISGEPATQEGSVEWTGTAGKPFDTNDPPTGTTFIGRCVGKQLFISDVDEKKKKVEALVKIMAPSSEDEPERVIGTFPSRPIKVISKPSKKRQSAKNLERTLLSVSNVMETMPNQPPLCSVHQSRVYHLFVPPSALTNGIHQVSLCVRFGRVFQRIRWRRPHGPGAAQSDADALFYRPYCQLGYVYLCSASSRRR